MEKASVENLIIQRLEDFTCRKIRPLHPEDFDHGFFETLESLASVNLTKEKAIAIFQRRRNSNCFTWVYMDEIQVVGTASLVLEEKYIHTGGFVGHLEDVAVRLAWRGNNIGTQLVNHVIDEAKLMKCYRMEAVRAIHLKDFYERCGFYDWGTTVRKDLK